MIKHIILWELKEDLSDPAAVKAGIKTALEDLPGKIPGLLSLRVRTEFQPTANVDVMLDSDFESLDALKAYAVHPAHVAAANTYVRPFTKIRLAADYEADE